MAQANGKNCAAQKGARELLEETKWDPTRSAAIYKRRQAPPRSNAEFSRWPQPPLALFCTAQDFADVRGCWAGGMLCSAPSRWRARSCSSPYGWRRWTASARGRGAPSST